MTRDTAARLTRDELDKHGLKDWHVRLTTDLNRPFLGLCSYKDKCIILNAHHIDIHPDPEIVNTIKHEVAHALCPMQGHNEIWAAKAKEIGCDNTFPCSHLSLSPEVIDAIRSGATVEIEFDEEIIRRPKYTITRLQDKCDTCGKVAVQKSEVTVEGEEFDTKYIVLECLHLQVKKIKKGTPFHKLVSNENGTCAHQFDKNLCVKCGEYKPYDFQIDGMRHGEAALSASKGWACFDEMGLGKTIQALGLIKFDSSLWPVLYIVKSGIKFQWYKQILTWLGDPFAGQIIETSNDYLIPGLRTYIIGYDMLVHKTRKSKTGKTINQGFDIEKFKKIGIKLIVLDECQQIKNPDSSRTQQVRKIAKECKVIALSGTPWKNRGSEFFSVLNMLNPLKFSSFEGYKRVWVQYYYEGNRTKEGGIRNPEKFKDYIKEIAIRRERTEVMKELPLVNRMKLYIQLNPDEEAIYDEAVQEFVDWYNKAIIGGDEETLGTINILAKMSKMRHLTGLAKIPATIEFIEEFAEETERKLVVFVHHQDVGQMLFDQVKEKYGNEIPVYKLVSSMNGEERFKTQEEFNRNKRAIMIASTLASGEGINLQTCADCVMHERQWNPANEEQAEGRFIRIGQTADSVNATYVEASGSIDEHFGGIVEQKRKQFHSGMNKGEAPKWDQNSLVKELADLIVRKHKEKKKKSA